MDNLTPAQRCRAMASVRSTNTAPEMCVRRLVHSLGYRFRLHRRDLPGTPDLVFPARSKVIFVHGCFWHRHRCKQGQSMPASNAAVWKAKFNRNIQRDRMARRALRSAGWEVLVIWECQIKRGDQKSLASRIRRFLG